MPRMLLPEALTRRPFSGGRRELELQTYSLWDLIPSHTDANRRHSDSAPSISSRFDLFVHNGAWQFRVVSVVVTLAGLVTRGLSVPSIHITQLVVRSVSVCIQPMWKVDVLQCHGDFHSTNRHSHGLQGRHGLGPSGRITVW